MRIAIMQPYLFPYLGYFQLISAADKFILYDDVQYTYRSWINRNRILSPQGIHLFTFPVKKSGLRENINQKFFASNFNYYKQKFLKNIYHSYKNAPQQKTVLKLLEKILAFEELNLAKFIGHSLQELCKYLKIRTVFLYASACTYNRHLKRQDRLIDLAKNLKTTEYLNSIGGTVLYSKKEFAKHNLKLLFLKTKNINYRQFNQNFIPDLSIIDILMFNNQKEITKLMKQYELIK